MLSSITLTYIFVFKIANIHLAVPTDVSSLVRHMPSSCVRNNREDFKLNGATSVACTQ